MMWPNDPKWGHWLTDICWQAQMVVVLRGTGKNLSVRQLPPIRQNPVTLATWGGYCGA